MLKYNFKKMMQDKQVQNEEWVCQGHFLIKKSILTKTELKYINPKSEDGYINQLIDSANSMKDRLEALGNRIIFNPTSLDLDDNKEVNILYDGLNKIAINKEYYNMFTKKGCILYKGENKLDPILIYKNDEFVGLLMLINIKDNFKGKINYKNYISELEEKKQAKKELDKLKKKCLYISNNKAVIKNKPLKSISEILDTDKYNNLYVEATPDQFGDMELFIDLGIIYMSTNRFVNMERITDDAEHYLDGYEDVTLEFCKKMVNNRLKSMDWITTAEIKLMELAGENEDFIHELWNHRDKVTKLREEKRIKEEKEAKEEEERFVSEQNKIADDIITEAEQAILKGEKVINKGITIYESECESNDTSLILHLMKKYDVKVHLRTQGWINETLHSIFTDDDGEYTYDYYSNSSNSKTFRNYLNELVSKIKEDYRLTS